MRYRIINPCLILFLSLSLPACQKPATQAKTDRYPWEISLQANGTSRIFGIELGVTKFGEVAPLLGQSPKAGLFENPDGKLSLELFYKEFTRAGLSARLVLTLRANEALLQGLKQQAVGKNKLESGVVQYSLDATALTQIEAWPVAAMTYMPYANLEEEVVLSRFGEPAEKIRSHEQAQHWLYPDKGLDLILNEAGKDILQYVPPAEFAALVKPLHR